MEIAKSITAFFSCKNVREIKNDLGKKNMELFCLMKLRLSPSIMEYVIKQIFVHLDDQNESIQMAIYNTLKFAARVTPETVYNEVLRRFLKKFIYFSTDLTTKTQRVISL